jgi:uncharacterized protein YegP (UPF0339 family)
MNDTRVGKFEYWENDNGTWYFHLKSPNGRVICASQGYANKRNCLAGVDSVRLNAGTAVTIGETVTLTAVSG